MIYTVTLNPAIDKELTVDAISADTVLRATNSRSDIGGKGFNVSRMLQVLGASSNALAFAAGQSGQQLQDGLEKLGIATDFVMVGGETRTNVSIVSSSSSQYIKVNESGPTISQTAQTQLLDKVQTLASAGDWWVLAGSLPPGVSADFYAQLVTILKKADAHVMLDASGEPLRLGCAAKPDLIKPNDTEAQQLTGETEPKLQAMALREMGPSNVIISLGKDGALASTPSGLHQVAAPVIVEQNPIGAGDSLVAGVVWGLTQPDATFESALRWGIACGASAASQPGTGMGDRSQIEALRDQIVV